MVLHFLQGVCQQQTQANGDQVGSKYRTLQIANPSDIRTACLSFRSLNPLLCRCNQLLFTVTHHLRPERQRSSTGSAAQAAQGPEAAPRPQELQIQRVMPLSSPSLVVAASLHLYSATTKNADSTKARHIS